MEETFKIRAYGYSELAQLYFPNISKKSASIQLGRWIKENSNLTNKLVLAGHRPKQKLLTPLQVGVIVEILGIP